jgi:hypothetical protein
MCNYGLKPDFTGNDTGDQLIRTDGESCRFGMLQQVELHIQMATSIHPNSTLLFARARLPLS